MTDKDLEALMKAAMRQGFTRKQIKSGWMIYPPDTAYQPITVHLTASDHRAIRNVKAALKRAGYKESR